MLQTNDKEDGRERLPKEVGPLIKLQHTGNEIFLN